MFLQLDMMKLQRNKFNNKYLSNKTRLIAGFTLIELLIVVAIIGILAGVGVPMYNGYIQSSKEDVAKSNLKAIALMQASFFSDNNSYCLTGCNTSTKINTNLFEKTTLDTSGDYDYKVVNDDSGFNAVATPKSGSGLTQHCLNQNNDEEEDSGCP